MKGYETKTFMGFTWEKIGFVHQVSFGDRVFYTRCGEVRTLFNFSWRW